MGFGCHPVLKIKSPLLCDNIGIHPHVKIRLKLPGWPCRYSCSQLFDSFNTYLRVYGVSYVTWADQTVRGD